VGELSNLSENEANGVEPQRQAVALLRAVVETAVDGILTIDASGRIVTANPAIQRIFGYSPEELIGKNVKMLMPSPYHEEHDGYLANYTQTGQRKIIGIGREVEGRRKDGTVFPIDLAVGETVTADGPIFTGIIRDITERKSAERTLRESEARFRVLADSAPVLVWLSGLDRTCYYFNKPWLEFTGRTLEQEIGTGWAEGVYKEDLDRCLATYYDAFDRREAFDMEYRLRHASGEFRWVLDRGTPLHDEKGEFTGYIGGCIDITERKGIEEALQRERALLKSVVDTAVDGIITINEVGTIITANPATRKIFGYELEELIGKNVKLLMPSPYQEEHDGYLAAYRETGVRKIIGIGREVKGKRKDGSVFPLELAVSETVTEQGRVFTGIVRDVTERKRAQEMLLEKEAAERANEAKSEFLSRMSHELRTPLNAVLGFAQLLDMRYDDPRILEATQAIIKAGNHLLMLINEILDLARIESGTLSLSIEAIEIIDVISHAIDLTEPLAAKAGVTINVDFDSFSGVVVRADSQRLLQALINIISNAIKYNRPSGFVSIRGHREDGTFRIDVTDTGTGISEKDRPMLFAPFQRFGDLNIEGSGLGLTVTKNFLERMEGEIGLADSGPGGSTFFLRLKLAQASDIKDGKQAAGELGESPVLGGSPIVLYVEDNLSNFRLLELAMEDWGGIKLLSAVQGQIGLELAKAHKPDLILLDLHLPDIPGYEVLNILKSDPSTADIPVVVISADAMSRQIKRLIEAGAHEYLTKPIDLRRLGSVVRAVLEKRSGQR
jgi:PAS domain S-box-containing protein